MEVNRIAIKVSAAAERKIKSGHPWVFDQAVEKVSKPGKAGDLAIIYDRKTNKRLAVGLYDPASVIRIKVLSNSEAVQLNQQWFDGRIQGAFNLRNHFEKTFTNAYRILHGENDGFPGLIVDRYTDYAVIKIYSEIWIPYLDLIQTSLHKLHKFQGLLLRTSRLVQKQTKENSDVADATVLYGTIPDDIEFLEFGLKFKTNLRKGHKTGHFLDQRHNRHKISKLAKGKRVLDVFSYTGGFTVHALSGAAAEVSSLDVSKHALALAQENVQLNFKNPKHKIICGDAFETMEAMVRMGTNFDLVIIDPPSFAKRKEEIEIAKKKYAELVMLGVKLVVKQGILMMASCSSRITNDSFFDLVEEQVSRSGRKYRILEKTFHDIDHPISFPESSYLKGVYYGFE